MELKKHIVDMKISLFTSTITCIYIGKYVVYMEWDISCMHLLFLIECYKNVKSAIIISKHVISLSNIKSDLLK